MRHQPASRHHRAAKGIPRRKDTEFQRHSQDFCRESYHRASAEVPPSHSPSHSPSHRRTREPHTPQSRIPRGPVGHGAKAGIGGTVPQRIPGAASPTGAQCPSVPHGTATAGRLANEHGGKGQTRRGGLECRSAHALREWAAHAAHTERPQRRRLTRRPRAQSSQADSKDASRGGCWGACPRGCG